MTMNKAEDFDEVLWEKQKKEIDSLSQYEMCRIWRFSVGDNPLLQNFAGVYFAQRLKGLGGFTPAISKALGWGEPNPIARDSDFHYDGDE